MQFSLDAGQRLFGSSAGSYAFPSRYMLTLELTKNGATPPLFPHTAQ